jgi:DNA-binding MarR family transcriptional regulator
MKPRLTDREYEEAVQLRLALRTFLRRSEEVARAHKLTPQRYQLLLLIKTSEGKATVGRLCRSLQLGQSNVTQLVRRAEDLGLVRRELSPSDARVKHLRLTPEGERRLAAVVADLAEDRSKLIAALTDAGQPEPPV